MKLERLGYGKNVGCDEMRRCKTEEKPSLANANQ